LRQEIFVIDALSYMAAQVIVAMIGV